MKQRSKRKVGYVQERERGQTRNRDQKLDKEQTQNRDQRESNKTGSRDTNERNRSRGNRLIHVSLQLRLFTFAKFRNVHLSFKKCVIMSTNASSPSLPLDQLGYDC